MRFLLKPTARSAAAKFSQNIIASASATKAVASSQQHAPTATRIPTSSSKGWGQQCSPTCGCVLRIETQLSETPLSISPTIVQASYHAKRVMATNTTTNDANDIQQLKPLLVTTQHSNSSTGAPSRPILTSCTCPTLHTLAKRTIEHLPGKTLAQVRNEIGNNMGSSSAGLRSSVALRHTVLREQMIQIDPTTVSVSSRMGTKKNKNKLGIAIASSVDSIQHQQLGKRHITDTQIKNGDIHSASASASGAQEMNLTDRHGHCYDLFEDSLLSMIYERMPSPRKEDHSATYSPTLGGPFRMYSIYERNKPPTPEMNDEIKQEQQQQELEHYHDLLSSYEGRSWQTRSPSSFFLFGDGYSSSPTNGTSSRSSSTLNMTSMLFQNMMESIHTGIFGEEKRRNNAATATTDAAAADRDDDYAASTSYLELLDMYGDEHNGDEDHQQALDDWLEYVDQMHYSDGVNRSRSTG